MKKTSQKILCLIVCLTVIFSSVITVLAFQETAAGTKKDPYVISDASDLDKLSQAVKDGDSFADKYFVLDNDIEVSSAFSPIGTKETPFSGNFDGKGFEISGLDIVSDYAGLFAVTDSASVSSLKVSGCFDAIEYAGAIVAYATNTVITDCISDAEVYADDYCGGIVGYISSGKISGCSTPASAYIGGYNEYCGGIAGYSGAEINSCTNKAFISGEKHVGGIAGQSTTAIISSVNNANISSYSSNLGGIAGLASGTVKYCKNTGKVSADYTGVENTGGIVGLALEVEIVECYSTGKVTAKGNNAGGIAGKLTNSSVTNCINTGAVSNTKDNTGGIFGYASNSSVSKCISTDTVTSSTATLGAIGGFASGTVTDCYYNSDSNSSALYSGTATGTTGLTAEKLSAAENFPLLDFKKIWTINEAHSSFPLLLSIPFHTFEEAEHTLPDCTDDGIIRGVCIYCKEESVEIFPALGHSYVITAQQSASCTTDGYVDKYCAVCSYSTTDEIEAYGHTDVDGNKTCDVCSQKIPSDKDSRSFFQKIADFFKSIIDWIENLFDFC